MDPPSFTRKILRDELNVSEKEVDKYLKVLAIKAAKISHKLSSSTPDIIEPELINTPLQLKQSSDE